VNRLPDTLQSAVRRRMIDRKLTPEELATLADVPTLHVKQWLRLYSGMKTDRACKLLSALDLVVVPKEWVE
jgi:hypothetical protein